MEVLKPNSSEIVLLIVILNCQDSKVVQCILSVRMRMFCVSRLGERRGGGKTGVRQRDATLSFVTLNSAFTPVR